jgi:oligoribonuclease
MNRSKDNLVWIDCEMTGLDPDIHSILEIAVLITDYSFEEIVEGPELVIGHNKTELEVLEPWSKNQHTKSGLVERVLHSDVTMADAEKQVLEFVQQYCLKEQSPLCGNSICYDRRFIQKHMPKLAGFLHHRHIDVSTIKELVSHRYPEPFHAPPGKDGHRAMDDIRGSIDELKHYRDRVFVKAISEAEVKELREDAHREEPML